MSSVNYILDKATAPINMAKNDSIKLAILIIMALVMFCTHFFVFSLNFLLIFVDADQLIVAEAAKIYASFYIPEPYFFGQDYLFLLESFLAAPLIWMSIRADYAVNIICGMMFYMPFLVAIIYLHKKNLFLCACIIAMPFLLDTRFVISAMMPRGFIGSIGMGAVAMLVYILDKRHAVKRCALIALGICIASYNAAALFIPVLVIGYENPRQFVKQLCFVGLGIAIIKSFGIFYYIHPAYVVHHSPEYIIHSPMELYDGIRRFIRILTTVHIMSVPFQAFPTTWIIISFFVLHWKNNRFLKIDKKVIVALFGVFLVILAWLSLKKITDATDSLFFSGVRFYLALPYCVLAIVAYISSLEENRCSSIREVCIYVIGVVVAIFPLLLVAGEWIHSNATIESMRPSPVQIGNRKYVVDSCKYLDTYLGKKYLYGKIKGRNDLVAYGCDVYTSRKIVQTFYERRHWLAKEVANSGKPVGSIPATDIRPLL